MASETVKIQGREADFTAVYGAAPATYSTSSTEVLSTAIDTRLYPRTQIFVVASHTADATSTGVTVTVKESATSGGSYTTATFTGTAGASNSARTVLLQVKRNLAKPFIKVSMTPAGGSGATTAQVLFI